MASRRSAGRSGRSATSVAIAFNRKSRSLEIPIDFGSTEPPRRRTPRTRPLKPEISSARSCRSGRSRAVDSIKRSSERNPSLAADGPGVAPATSANSPTKVASTS